MFGGKMEAGSGNVTDELWVFNVPGRSWQRRNPVVGPAAQAQIYAVEGHSAHCVQLENGEVIMLVIFGYSPIYSYICNIQEYNLSEWTAFVTSSKISSPGVSLHLHEIHYTASLQNPTHGWYLKPKVQFPREVMATAARTTVPAAPCTFTEATRPCLPANTDSLMTSTAMKLRVGHGKHIIHTQMYFCCFPVCVCGPVSRLFLMCLPYICSGSSWERAAFHGTYTQLCFLAALCSSLVETHTTTHHSAMGPSVSLQTSLLMTLVRLRLFIQVTDLLLLLLQILLYY